MKTVKKAPDKTIEDTGERMVPAYHKGQLVYGEHIVRYEGARELVKNKTILDIASGSGYGSAVLAESAKKVYGVDVNQEAITYATENYGSENTEFLLSDGIDIPLGDNTVDVVVSFETIEHIEDYEHFMKEVKRVLKSDGLLILSTPNDVEFPEGAHFHIHEFKHTELQKLVARYFSQTKEYFQATWTYNALLSEEQLKSEWELPVDTINAAPIGLEKVLYFYMLCANREVTETISPLGAISEHWSTRTMLTHNANMDKYIKDTMAHYETIIAAKEKHLTDLRKEASELHEKMGKLSKQMAHMRLSLHYRVQSKLSKRRTK